jgi:hypothetical protein
MARNASDIPAGDSSKFQKEVLAPNGYPARVVGLTFVGVQNQRPYMGQAKPPADELRITYELSHEFMKDEDGKVLEDKPRWLTETIPFKSLKLDKAKSSKRYAVLDPTGASGGEWQQLLGAPCTVVVTNNAGKGKHEGKVFENIGDVTPKFVNPIPGQAPYEQPELINPTSYYDLNDTDCTLEDFRALPEFVQEIIMGANDYSASNVAKLLGAESGKPPAAEDSPQPQATADVGEGEDPY